MTWVRHMLRTADEVAGDGDAGARLRLRSGGLWLLGVLCAALVAWVASRVEVTHAEWIGLGTGGAAVFVGLFLRSSLGAVLALFGASMGLGLLVAGLDRGTVDGIAPTFALAFGGAELVALLAIATGRDSWAGAVSVAAAAATTSGLAWVLDAGIVPATPWGVAAGGGLAILVTLHARWGEGAIAARHGAQQLWHAAATRFLEGPRGIALRLIGLFSSDDDLFASDAT